ncbi:MAG: hypothetical protein ACKO46_03135, partial [Alphaproteobacteria bacterium]
MKDLFKRYEKTDDKIFQRIKQYKEAVLYGLGAWILSEAKIDDEENNIENIGKFLNLITKKLNEILKIRICNSWQYFEGGVERFFRIYCYIKTDKNLKNLSGEKLFESNKMFEEGENFWWSNPDERDDHFFIFYLLKNLTSLNFRTKNIVKEISQIIGQNR